jgi:hypothetical protein
VPRPPPSPDYQIDPHLRHDFNHPPPWGGRPPRQTHPPLRLSRSRWRTRWYRLRRRVRWWQARWGYRLADRLLGLPRQRPDQWETAALQLLVGGLTAIVLLETGLLILAAR